MFFFQYLVQAGFFFVVPLYLSVCLGLSALATGARLLPLSVTLLAAAIGIPQLLPNVLAAARRAPRAARAARRDGRPARRARRRTRAPEIVFVPLLLVGLGHRRARVAARRGHRLGRPGRREPRGRRPAEHGDEPRRVAGHGARRLDDDRGRRRRRSSTNIQQNPDIPGRVKEQATVKLAGGVRSSPTPTSRRRSTRRACATETTDAALAAYQDARIDGLQDRARDPRRAGGRRAPVSGACGRSPRAGASRRTRSRRTPRRS